MKIINKIVSDLKEFVDFFKIKYKYDQRGVLKRYRLKSGLNKKLKDDIWYDLFLEKAAYNYCAKFLLIKFFEDTGRIGSKINKSGLEKWHDLVTNIGAQYGNLYKLAESDMVELEEMRIPFKKVDYDIYEIDDELAEFMIEKLKEYDFKTFSYQTLYKIFTSMYLNDKRQGPSLQYFYKPANAIEYILDIKNHEENLVQ
ncbi:hypothetical protein [Caldisalinibacter kiritimatiensis]|uniref:Uncharacterized protein n=1 Tax=Caldisalinibacter kiritimatiensis TaxID=1304284 RepID=R1CPC8_9FIRM|nr:hypothetical protein [Caldisalinibacter kiritimatiensis]EOD00516.1 hypothetical protein L21TH_1437 [Caldisalinibacter kiritimatiensis]